MLFENNDNKNESNNSEILYEKLLFKTNSNILIRNIEMSLNETSIFNISNIKKYF